MSERTDPYATDIGKKSSKTQSKGTSMDTSTAARWAFIIGLVLAVVVALVPEASEWAVWLMLILGLFAGYVFITEEDELRFIILAVGLVFFSQTLTELPSIGETVTALVGAVSTFFGAMVIAIAVRSIIAWIRVG
jgi:uncharacterized membrane protein YgaE (UPF0421/DUF939 family)